MQIELYLKYCTQPDLWNFTTKSAEIKNISELVLKLVNFNEIEVGFQNREDFILDNPKMDKRAAGLKFHQLLRDSEVDVHNVEEDVLQDDDNLVRYKQCEEGSLYHHIYRIKPRSKSYIGMLQNPMLKQIVARCHYLLLEDRTSFCHYLAANPDLTYGPRDPDINTIEFARKEEEDIERGETIAILAAILIISKFDIDEIINILLPMPVRLSKGNFLDLRTRI